MLYTPAHFAQQDRVVALELMRRHPLATLISAVDGEEPVVSHLPLVAEQRGAETLLHGHLARANPQWTQWRDGLRLLAIFHGPDAYVSPFDYETREAVPTWNYAVVHAAGAVHLKHDSEAKEAVLKRLIDAHDLPYRQRWDELDAGYRERMKTAIVAFEITVDRIDAKFKLSQNRSAQDRAGVAAAMQRNGERGAEMVEWMQLTGVQAAA
jgi:transcriptional regulator